MNTNNRLLAIFSLMLSSLTIDSLIVNIQPSRGTSVDRCQAAVQSVRSQIQTGRNLEVLPAIPRNISASYPDAPQGRPDGYVISFRGVESQNILNSPQFMTTLARQIINQCENVGLVTFGVANSGDVVSFGLMPDGSIISFRCLETGLGIRPRWGEVVCT